MFCDTLQKNTEEYLMLSIDYACLGSSECANGDIL